MNRFLKRKRDKGESSEKSRKVVVRNYDSEYIKYGFTNAGSDLEPKAQCAEWAQIWSNKPSKFQRHLNSKRPEVDRKPFCEKERICRGSKES